MQNPISVIALSRGEFPPSIVVANETQKRNAASPVIICLPSLKSGSGYVEGGAPLLLLYCLQSKEDLTEILALLARHAERIKLGNLRVAVFNRLLHPKIPQILKSKGCHEILNFDLTLKALLHKIKTHLTVLSRHAQRASLSDEKSGGKSIGGKIGTEMPRSNELVDSAIRWVQPLVRADDFWIYRKKSDIKRVRGNWLIEMYGPGPAVGIWAKESESRWVWKVKDQSSRYASLDGEWIFEGREPTFNWKTNRWLFISEKPLLGVRGSSGMEPCKFKISVGGSLEFATNATDSEARLNQLESTFDPEYRFKQNKARTGASDYVDAADDIEAMGWNDRVKPDDDHAPDWNQHTSQDEAPQDWNQHESEPEAASAWNDTGARRDNVFNSGSGLSQGTGATHIDYKDPEWRTGGEAFAPIRIIAEFNQIPVEILERGPSFLKVELPAESTWQGEDIEITVTSENMAPSLNHTIRGRVMQLESEEGSDRVVVEMVTDSASGNALETLTQAIEQRQEEALRFLLGAKGY